MLWCYGNVISEFTQWCEMQQSQIRIHPDELQLILYNSGLPVYSVFFYDYQITTQHIYPFIFTFNPAARPCNKLVPVFTFVYSFVFFLSVYSHS